MLVKARKKLREFIRHSLCLLSGALKVMSDVMTSEES